MLARVLTGIGAAVIATLLGMLLTGIIIANTPRNDDTWGNVGALALVLISTPFTAPLFHGLLLKGLGKARPLLAALGGLLLMIAITAIGGLQFGLTSVVVPAAACLLAGVVTDPIVWPPPQPSSSAYGESGPPTT